MIVGSTFSGIGGLDLGLERAGHKVVWQCEIDEYRRAVLRERFNAPAFEDVREVATSGGERPKPGELGRERRGADRRRSGTRAEDSHVDLLCGGFPCQDLSVAGQRKGLDGDRSGLFFEFARIADAVRPDWVLLENVPGLFSSNGGRDFGVLLETLVDLGYGVAWRVLDSQFFGVPQRRRRVFILAHRSGGRAGAERAGEVLAVGSGCEGHPPARGEAGEEIAGTLGSRTKSGGPRTTDLDGHGAYVVAKALTAGGHPNSNMPGRRKEDDENLVALHLTQDPISGPEAPALSSNAYVGVSDVTGVRRLTPRECERLQGLPDDWTLIDWNGKPAPDSRRYAAIGDAVTVNVAQWIGERLNG